MPQQNSASVSKTVSTNPIMAILQGLEGLSEGIYVVGTLLSLGAFFFGISIIGAPVLAAVAGAGIIGFSAIAIGTKYRNHKKRIQTLKTAVEREKSALKHLSELAKNRLEQLQKELDDVLLGKQTINTAETIKTEIELLQEEIKLLKKKVSAYNQKTPPAKTATPKSTQFFTFYERFYNGLAGFKRAFTLRNVAGTTLLLAGLVVNAPITLAFTFVLGSILLTSRIITRNNEKKLPQDAKTVNTSAEQIEKANTALREKIELSNRAALGVINIDPTIAIEQKSESNPSGNKINTPKQEIKKNKLITALQIFEGVVEALYVVGSLFSIGAFFFGLAVVGSPLLIAAGAIGSVFFLGTVIAAKYRTDKKSHEALKLALTREEAAIKSHNELHPENRIENSEALKQSASKSKVDTFSTIYENFYQGLAAFKRGFTVRNVIGTTLLISAGLVFNAPGIIAAALVIGTLMAGSRIITKKHEKKIAEKANQANKLAEKIEKKNIVTRTQNAFQVKKQLVNEVEMVSLVGAENSPKNIKAAKKQPVEKVIPSPVINDVNEINTNSAEHTIEALSQNESPIKNEPVNNVTITPEQPLGMTKRKNIAKTRKHSSFFLSMETPRTKMPKIAATNSFSNLYFTDLTTTSINTIEEGLASISNPELLQEPSKGIDVGYTQHT